jgi:hypothetical protein
MQYNNVNGAISGIYSTFTNYYGTNLNVTTIYVTTIDALTGEGTKVLKLVVENGTTFPALPVDRQVFFRSDEGYLYVYNNSLWVQLGTTLYSNLTGTPDLTVYLTHDGATALSGDWNIGGSYGVYGATWLNSTQINALGFYLNGQQLGFVEPATFIIDYNATSGNYQAWYGANSTLAFQSTNASAVINNALWNLTTGGKVFLRNGGYRDIDINCTIPSNVTLCGEGWGTVLYGKSATNISVIRMSGVVNARVSNLRIDGNYVGNPQCVATDETWGNGIDIVDSQNCTVDNVVAQNCYWHGVQVRGDTARDITVRNCIADNNLWDGFVTLSGNCQRVRFQHCQANQNGNMGFYLEAGEHDEVSDCSAFNNTYAGIMAVGYFHTIRDNFCEYNGRYGMVFGSGTQLYRSSILNNICLGNGWVANNTYAVVYLKGSYCKLTGNILRGYDYIDSISNYVKYSTYGILEVSGSNNNTITDNDVTENWGGFFDGALYMGMSLRYGVDDIVKNNRGYGVPMMIAGLWHTMTNTYSGTANITFLTPVWIPQTGTITDFYFYISTGSAGTNITCSLWGDVGLTPLGGSLLWSKNQSAAVATSACVTLDLHVDGGVWVWAGITMQDTVQGFLRDSGNNWYNNGPHPNFDGCFFIQSVFAPLPSTCPAVTRGTLARFIVVLGFTPS